MRFSLDEDLPAANADDFIDLCREAIRLQRPHAGIVVCSHRFQGGEIAAITIALGERAERYPKGLGEYDLVYIQRSRKVFRSPWLCVRTG